MNPLLAEFLGAVIRWALNLLGAYLVTKHVITADQSDRFTAALTEHLLLWLPIVAGLAWSLFAKYRSRLKLLAARELPAGASDQQLLDRMKTFTVRDTFTN